MASNDNVGIAVVVPYRDRPRQLQTLVTALLARPEFGRIVIAEQAPGRPFNRGLVKNAGFMAATPDDDQTVYFHDVDIVPGPQAPAAYPRAPPKAAVHLYGHRHCLGGVVGVRAIDFATANGFPTSEWRWGGEDTALQARYEAAGMTVDRSRFAVRFGDWRAFAELDDAGCRITGRQALQAFQSSLRDKRRTGRGGDRAWIDIGSDLVPEPEPAPFGGLADMVGGNYVAQPEPDARLYPLEPRVRHIVVDPPP